MVLGKGRVRRRLYTHDVRGVMRSNIPKYLNIRHRNYYLYLGVIEVLGGILRTSSHNKDCSAFVD